MRILLVEDHLKLARLLQKGLREEKIVADLAATGADGVWMATEQPYDVLVLDVMLPDVDGLEVCRRIRAVDPRTPVLMLTALGAVPDRIAGLDAGADDYLMKPFAFDELLARLRALARRGGVPRATELRVGDLCLDPVTRRVSRAGTTISLTGQEFTLLEAMARRVGEVLTREQLVHLAWDIAYEARSNVVDVCVKGLRDRIDRPFGRRSLETVRGLGYRLVADEP
ncbi:response regulator transcription factor [Nocardioides cynanchi]|uniref:response regulator n=1 Tax=Nocardioides cynanchi TaxID=2558918 RepID=UPI0012476233|nr:response regulator transcription factor [Nocardioides cynanchi]